MRKTKKQLLLPYDTFAPLGFALGNIALGDIKISRRLRLELQSISEEVHTGKSEETVVLLCPF